VAALLDVTLLDVTLLDINCLIALVDSDHVGHKTIRRWFNRHWKRGWATCPLTENGMVRILSQPAYPSGQRTPAEVIQILNALKRSFAAAHVFWADDVSIADDTLFDAALMAGARQTTDSYLIGLAVRHQGVLISFDRSLVWQAVKGGAARFVHVLKAPAP
jgi:toxin-antitoxin system PIN domain toxin